MAGLGAWAVGRGEGAVGTAGEPPKTAAAGTTPLPGRCYSRSAWRRCSGGVACGAAARAAVRWAAGGR